MLNRKIKFIAFLPILFLSSSIYAQQSISTTGGDATGSGGSMSYSIGQVAYQTHTGTSGSVAEGVQQPYEISIVSGVKEAIGINLAVSAYPNPATDYLILKVESKELKGLSFQLYDLNGKVLKIEKITSNQTSIPVGNLVSATYFVKVLQGKKELKTFKIIKN